MTDEIQSYPSPKAVLGSLLLDLEPALMRPERLVEPDSWAGHIPFVSWLTAAARPRRYVELGVHTGNSYCAVAQTVARYQLGTECFGIDHWYGDEQAGLYGEDVYADLRAWHDPRYGHFSRLLRMSFEDGRDHVADGTVDILHIDGLHTYDAVRTDFETWRSKMSDRCIVLFHDTNVHRSDFGVWQYWREVQAQYPTFEFLHSNGLGVAFTGTKPLSDFSAAVSGLFKMGRDDAAVHVVRTYFDRLGTGLVEEIHLGATRRTAEKIARELQVAYRDLAALDRDRDRVLSDRDVLEARAIKWDQLAIRTGGAIGLSIDDISAALARLYNSDNPQALRDRSILKRQFSDLIASGTFQPQLKDLGLRLLNRLGRNVKDRIVQRSPVEEDPAIAAIRHSGLFDENFYSLTDDARTLGLDPLEHYLQIGEPQGVAPSPLFDPAYYARRQPDVAMSGFGLLRHYILFGKNENRHPVAPAQRLRLPNLGEKQRPRVLLLLENAQATDSVILASNIAHRLSQDHDVIAFFGRGGSLREGFASICTAAVDMPDEPGLQSVDRSAVLEKLAQDLQPDFAIICNADGRHYVRALVAAHIGVVQLVQEFASNIRPPNEVYNFLPFAHRLAFPSHVTAESFRREHPYLSQRQFDILKPGPTALPSLVPPVSETESFDRNVQRRLRPAGHEGDFLVVGMGDVSFQNGADIFVSLAATALATNQSDRPFRFVWIGKGFDPAGGDQFSSLLSDQIALSGVTASIEIISDLSHADEALRQADAFAFTSRLAPLAIAAVNAVAAGVPVLCFEQASSLAEHLLDAGEAAASLVVPYGDVGALVARLQRLASDSEFRTAAHDAMTEAGRSWSGMERYVLELIRLGKEAAEDAMAIDRDYRAIQASEPVFKAAVYQGTWPADSYPQDPLHSYLLRSRIARSHQALPTTGLRRPFAGFHPIIYAEDRLEPNDPTEPLVHWLSESKPQGRWTHQVIDLSVARQPAGTTPKTLLHGHFYYVDLLDDFLVRLNGNSSLIDLVITVPDENAAQRATAAIARNPIKGSAQVKVVENCGRDIGPFLTGLDDQFLAPYEIIGHIHGKKSPHVESITGDQWRSFLWEHTIGGITQAADICLAALQDNPDLGLVFPEDANLHGWDANLAIATSLVRKMGREAPLPTAFEWPIGTMFWARRAALAPLFNLNLSWNDYPKEPLAGDGTLLHALERVIPFAVELAGFGYATSHLEEVQR